jgi:hypothetical protein
MDKFLGSVDDQSIETMHIMGNGWIYAFFIIGAFLLVAGWLVRWQVRRVQGIMVRWGNSRAPVQSHCIRFENNINDGEFAREARYDCRHLAISV